MLFIEDPDAQQAMIVTLPCQILPQILITYLLLHSSYTFAKKMQRQRGYAVCLIRDVASNPKTNFPLRGAILIPGHDVEFNLYFFVHSDFLSMLVPQVSG